MLLVQAGEFLHKSLLDLGGIRTFRVPRQKVAGGFHRWTVEDLTGLVGWCFELASHKGRLDHPQRLALSAGTVLIVRAWLEILDESAGSIQRTSLDIVCRCDGALIAPAYLGIRQEQQAHKLNSVRIAQAEEWTLPVPKYVQSLLHADVARLRASRVLGYS